jgi:hypothetical protein
VKKKLNLQTLNNIQQSLEVMINNTTDGIIVNNAVLKDNKGDNIDTEALYDKLEKLFTQLDDVKLALDIGNRGQTSLKKTNKELILELSNLKRKKSLLETLSRQKQKRRNGKKEDAYEFIISKSKIEDRLLEVENRISEIKNAMIEFNNSTIIKIEIDESLDLI